MTSLATRVLASLSVALLFATAAQAELRATYLAANSFSPIAPAGAKITYDTDQDEPTPFSLVLAIDAIAYGVDDLYRDRVFGVLAGQPGDVIQVRQQSVSLCSGETENLTCRDITNVCNIVTDDTVPYSETAPSITIPRGANYIISRFQYEEPVQIKLDFIRSEKLYQIVSVDDEAAVVRSSASNLVDLCGSLN
ncbi:hypothetical protein [Bauldia sp.]|uniref:hypothetical protein n=1 Tax=Bauldia sp. TaxID=2575872 RepID=UPI003BAB02C0